MAELIGWAVVKALDTMVGVKPEIGKFDVVDSTSANGEIFGVMNIRTDSLEGVFILTFPKKTILHLIEKVYGNALKDVDRGMHDAVAEFTNVIYGLIKMGLNHRGVKIHMSLPTVITGDRLQLLSTQKGPFLELPIQVTAEHPFHALFYLRELHVAQSA